MAESIMILPLRLCEVSDRKGSYKPCILLFTIRNTVKEDDFFYIINHEGERLTHGAWQVSLRQNGRILYPNDLLKTIPPVVLMGDKDDWNLFKNKDVINLDHRAFPITQEIKRIGFEQFVEEYKSGIKLVGRGITWRLEKGNA